MFTTTRSALLPLLTFIASAMDKKNTIPILSNVLIRTEGDDVTFAATDLDTTKITKLKEVKPTPPLNACVAGKKLIEIVKALPTDAEIEFSTTNSKLLIRSGTARFQMPTTDIANFPEINYNTKVITSIPAATIEAALNRTISATTKEESRYALHGINIEIATNSCLMTATNGHRLAHCCFAIEYPEKGKLPAMIVPVKTCESLLTLSKQSETITLSVDDPQNPKIIKFENETGETIASRLVSGQFPNYEMVMPKSNKITCAVSVEALLLAAKRISLMADERSQALRLTFAANQLTLEAQASDIGDASETVECEYKADEIKMGVNSEYLVETLSCLETDEAKIKLKDGNSQFFITEKGETLTTELVIMPMRL
jgi:DNA polymerase III subunit beta